MPEDDGLRPMTFRDLLARLEPYRIFEKKPTKHAGIQGCHVMARYMMGLGTPYYTIVADGDDALVYPPTIRSMLKTFGLDVRQFLAPAAANGSARRE